MNFKIAISACLLLVIATANAVAEPISETSRIDVKPLPKPGLKCPCKCTRKGRAKRVCKKARFFGCEVMPCTPAFGKKKVLFKCCNPPGKVSASPTPTSSPTPSATSSVTASPSASASASPSVAESPKMPPPCPCKCFIFKKKQKRIKKARKQCKKYPYCRVYVCEEFGRKGFHCCD